MVRKTFTTTANKQLSGELTKARPGRLVIICHGYKSSGQTPTITALSKGLNQNGYSTFTFDFPKGSEVDVRRQVADIAEIIEHFNGYSGFVLLAASYGALSGSIAAITVPKVDGLITINGFFGSRQLGKQHRRTYRMFRLATLILPSYRKIWQYYKSELRPDKLKIPALVIHSKVDQVVSFEQSKHFFDKIESPKQFTVLEHASHGLSSAADVAEVIAVVDAWLSQL